MLSAGPAMRMRPGLAQAVLTGNRLNRLMSMNFLEALRWRYATKKFDPQRRVSDEDLESILEAGNLTPTSFGLQPYRFVVVQDPQKKQQLEAVSYGQRQVVDASHVIVIATRTDVDERYIGQYTRLTEQTRELPVGTLDSYRDMMVGTVQRQSPEAQQDWHRRQAYIALGMMMSAAAVLGIDSCPMEGFQVEAYDRILELAPHQLTAAIVLPIGYRSADDSSQFQAKVRWPLEQMVIRM